jgi:transposase-like protein
MVDRVEQILKLAALLTAAELKTLQQRLETLKEQDAETAVDKPIAVAKRSKKVKCPKCASSAVKGHGMYRERHRYKCLSCAKTFNELTDTPLAGVHNVEKLREFVSTMAGGGVSLRKSAGTLDIGLKTAFRWRHRAIEGYMVAPSRKLKGIVEADETFFLFSEKGDKTVSARRKPRGRGGKAATAGISSEHVPVIICCDREAELIAGVAGRGRISLKAIERVLGNRVGEDATLCTDSHTSFKAFAKANHLKYQPVNISKGNRVVKGIYHIQHVNNAHTRLKTWMVRFQGVSTKYLESYVRWFSLMEETKTLTNREAKFTERSVTNRRVAFSYNLC